MQQDSASLWRQSLSAQIHQSTLHSDPHFLNSSATLIGIYILHPLASLYHFEVADNEYFFGWRLLNLWTLLGFLRGIMFYNPELGFLIKPSVRSSNWHFAHLILQFPRTEHLHGIPHESMKGQISTIFDGGAKYVPNFSSQVAGSSWRLSTSSKAPPKNISFAPLSWRFSVTCFRARVLWVQSGSMGWVLDHALTPASLPAPADRCPAPSRSARVAPSFPHIFFTFLPGWNSSANSLTFPQVTPHATKKLSRLGVSLVAALWRPLPSGGMGVRCGRRVSPH